MTKCALLHRPESALEWLTYSITCFVRLMVDGMVGHCLITATLSIKYLELMVERITWHLQTLVSFSSHQAASQYFFTRTQIVVHCIHGAQPHTSAAILMAALRICQIISLLTLDHVNKPRRYSSLAQLPIAIFFTMTILFYIQRYFTLFQNISLTETWQRSTLRDPDIVDPPETAEAPAAREQQHQLIHRISKEEERNRAVVLWYQIIRHAPPVAGKVLGMGASRGMYWAVLVVGTLYTTGVLRADQIHPAHLRAVG
ncbi:hypothetical protein FJT64_021833 [Amphibalanus amphitrite]|uniref:Uncharacterized protein n=1 Tax=Amphibalanus amphitrite TaxID=1232801 RepID=A0A6A4WWE5_AMPAM|nr:hypothetical protein FJT64_021833 [Amphibalanus amphitrite]